MSTARLRFTLHHTPRSLPNSRPHAPPPTHTPPLPSRSTTVPIPPLPLESRVTSTLFHQHTPRTHALTHPQGKELARQAATVINPTDHPAEEDPATHTQYVRSHGDFGPGEQRQRGYNWQAPGIDPATYRFGAVDPNQVRDGVKQALTAGLDPEAQVGAGDGGLGDGEKGCGEAAWRGGKGAAGWERVRKRGRGEWHGGLQTGREGARESGTLLGGALARTGRRLVFGADSRLSGSCAGSALADMCFRQDGPGPHAWALGTGVRPGCGVRPFTPSRYHTPARPLAAALPLSELQDRVQGARGLQGHRDRLPGQA